MVSSRSPHILHYVDISSPSILFLIYCWFLTRYPGQLLWGLVFLFLKRFFLAKAKCPLRSCLVALQTVHVVVVPVMRAVNSRMMDRKTRKLLIIHCNIIIIVNDIWNKLYMNCGNEMKMKKWSSQWTQFLQLRKEAWKKIHDDHFFIFISFPQFIYDLFHISLTSLSSISYNKVLSFDFLKTFRLRINTTSKLPGNFKLPNCQASALKRG